MQVHVQSPKTVGEENPRQVEQSKSGHTWRASAPGLQLHPSSGVHTSPGSGSPAQASSPAEQVRRSKSGGTHVHSSFTHFGSWSQSSRQLRTHLKSSWTCTPQSRTSPPPPPSPIAPPVPPTPATAPPVPASESCPLGDRPASTSPHAAAARRSARSASAEFIEDHPIERLLVRLCGARRSPALRETSYGELTIQTQAVSNRLAGSRRTNGVVSSKTTLTMCSPPPKV